MPAEPGGGGEPAEPAEPPPEPAAERPGRPEPPPDPVRQLSLFGVEAADPAVGDLAGLLAGPGELVRMGGTARITIMVDDAWRVHVLVAELARRGLTASWLGRTRAAERHGVQTSYSTLLAPLGAAWLRETVKRPPANFFLTGPRLRIWVAAAGTPEPLGFLLRLGAADEACWEPVGAALAAIGLPAVLLDAGAGGPAYRITGRRRLARLAELVGDRPPAAPPGQWPGSVAPVPSIG
ncbi:hypothetical protein ACN27G_27355 [Plantactinospora sp. WMMB334]|uniref:hypothetical protein n=1 Tax=Plantactinospora sp. WMMB334 TaxID=3404119 RepID=UPI003B92DD8E